MTIKITVPRLGWSMEEGTFSEWLKRDGDSVAAGDLLFVLENDKASQEVESLDSGVLHIPADAPKPGDKVTVGQLLGYLLADGERAPAAELPTAVTPTLPVATSDQPVLGPVSISSPQPGAKEPIITPRARRVATELGVDWVRVPGTGRDRRIREADIRNAAATQQSKGFSSMRRTIAERTLASQQKAVAVTLHTTADATSLVQLRGQLKSVELFTPRSRATFDETNRPPLDFATNRPPLDKGGVRGGLEEPTPHRSLADRSVPGRGIAFSEQFSGAAFDAANRPPLDKGGLKGGLDEPTPDRPLADRGVSGRGIAFSEQFSGATFDATNRPPLDKGGLKGGLDEANATETVVPTYNDILVKLVAVALQKHPILNSRWEGETLCPCTSIHIGIAVDTEGGLLVPVIRDVAKLTLHEVALRSRSLIERAHSKRLSTDELCGGTFTVTSLGSLGIDAFTPIINYPECAILGVGRILRQPVAVGETIALRDIITLSLTFDHRALDGAPAARFLQTLTKLIESPLIALGLG